MEETTINWMPAAVLRPGTQRFDDGRTQEWPDTAVQVQVRDIIYWVKSPGSQADVAVLTSVVAQLAQ